MLNELIKNFKTLTKSLEILYVIEDIKPVSRILIKEKEISQTNNFLKKYNLKTTLSDFKITNNIDANRTYSDKGMRINKNSIIPGKFFMYISKSIELAEQAKQQEEKNNHLELGRLLGYPKCCREFFEKNFPIESIKNNDYTLTTLKNSIGFKFPFYTNIAIRHLDLTLLSHFPCSFNCEESIKIAKSNLNTIKKHSDNHNIITSMLKEAVIYTSKGVFLLKNTRLGDNKLFYEKTIGPENNGIYHSLKSSADLEIINKNNIKIKNQVLQDIGFMLFS